MKLSIIIVSWNVQENLRNCLNSILTQAITADYEIIVVDNASQDQTVGLVLNQFPTVKLITNNLNLGFAKAVNQGAAAAQGEYLLLLNPDTVVRDGSLDQLLDTAVSFPLLGALGGKIVNPDGSVQPSVRKFPTLCAMILVILSLHRLMPGIKTLRKYFQTEFDYTRMQSVDQVMGAYFLVPLSVWQQLGGLDEKFFLWFEEVDFCRRAKAAGFDVVYAPTGEVIHESGQSFGQLLTLRKRLIFNRSLRHYFRKHKQFAAYFIVWLFQPLSLLIAGLGQIVLRFSPGVRRKS